MTTTWTPEANDRLTRYLARDGYVIPIGLGTEEAACSVAAINLALTGQLKDDIPDCMSKVIGSWIIRAQDAMPDDIRNSQAWRELLPMAAGTGRALEQERLALILEWMWDTVLPSVQPVADKRGYGAEWRTMCKERTTDAARDAAKASARDAARAARSAARASAWDAAKAARIASWDAAWAARSASWAAERTDAWAAAWAAFDPCGLLRRLIDCEEKNND